METCPDPLVWLAHAQGSPPDEAAEAHLASCASCRKELASLMTAEPLPSPARLKSRLEALVPAHRRGLGRQALAASLLLAAGGGWLALRSRPATGPVGPTPPSQVPAHGALISGCRLGAPELLERAFGASGLITLPAGSRARLEPGQPWQLHLEAGTARVETAGDPLRVTLSGWKGALETEGGELSLAAGSGETAGLLLREACAGEPAWGLRVERGEAHLLLLEGGTRLLQEGETLGSPPPPADPRGWLGDEAGPLRVRDGLRELSSRPPRIAEVLVRKRARTAEAAVVFSAGGHHRQLMLGSLLSAEGGWIRLRLEAGADLVRVLAGDRELVHCPPDRLDGIGQPAPESASWGIRAWGGDLELREARWR